MAKEERQAKREARKVNKATKVAKTVDTQISDVERSVDKDIAKTTTSVNKAKQPDFTWDIPKPNNWENMSAEQQNKWDEQNKQPIVARGFAQKLEQINRTYSPPKEKLPTIDRDKLINLETKRKKRKWMDIAHGVLTGMEGGTVDPSKLPTHRLQAQKDQIFQEYKDVALRNQKTQDAWNRKQYETRMGFLEEAYKKAQSPEEKEMFSKRMEQADKDYGLSERRQTLAENEFKARKAGGYYKKTTSTKAKKTVTQQTEDGNWLMSSSNYPHTDLLYSLSENADELFPDPGDKRYSPSEKEDLAKQLINQAFTYKTDENGNRIAVPKKGKENFLNNKLNERKLADIDNQIKDAEMMVQDAQDTLDDKGRFSNKDEETANLQLQQEVLQQLINERKALSGEKDADNTRNDGTAKGTGYFGVLKTSDGRDATEMSIGVFLGGKETEIPTLIPTLSEDEKQYLLDTPIEEHFTDDKVIFALIKKKAIAHARKRIKEGKSPFAKSSDYKHTPGPTNEKLNNFFN